MTDSIRGMIEDRRTIFRTDEKRSDRWKDLKEKVSSLVKKRKAGYDRDLLNKFDKDPNPRNFYHHVNGLLSEENKPRWSPASMYPGKDKTYVAEELASYFNSISCEYEPLAPENIPLTFDRILPRLSAVQVAERIRKMKKPSSVVPGDVPPSILSKFASEFSVPVSRIFNLITDKQIWPEEWRKEYVTGIPKIAQPQDPSECRNISCTNFFSKLYESFVLEWSREEVRPKMNQYGGEPGAGATIMLTEVMDNITIVMEDNRSAVVLSAIDFSKAFNRLQHDYANSETAFPLLSYMPPR